MIVFQLCYLLIYYKIRFVYPTVLIKFVFAQENHLIIYGRSMGSGFEAHLASENKQRYLILDAPYFSFKKML